MKIDLKRLTMALKGLTEEESSAIAFKVSKYLIENVYEPLMRDEPVYYENLNFNAFDREDIYRLGEWIDHLCCVKSSLHDLNKGFCSAPPAAVSSRTFF